MIKVAILGAGWVAGDRHIPAYKQRRGVEIVGIFDRNIERARAAARGLQGCLATDQLDAVLDTAPNAVSICTSPWSHAELAIAALDHGCHVLVEKPMAMNLGEAVAMADAAWNAGRLLCVSHNFLFSRAVTKADRWLASDDRGRHIIGVQLSSQRRRLPNWHEALPGGLLFDEIPHMLYLMGRYMGGLDVVAVRSIDETGGMSGIIEVQIAGERGSGHITVASGAPISEWHLTVVSESSVVDLDLFRDIAVRLPAERAHGAPDILKTTTRALKGHIGGFISSGIRLSAKRLSWGHNVLIARFLDAIAANGESPVSITAAMEVVAASDTILAALESG